MILCANPRLQYLARKGEIDGAVMRVLDRGRYILGEEVKALESEFAAYIGVEYGIGVGSGTEGLHLALKACGIGVGDEVITVSHTAVATVAAIEQAGASPVMVDIEPEFFTIDSRKIATVITPKTKAIIPVHLYGQPADLNPILEIARTYELRVIEDCSQAHGATYNGRRVGSYGDLACFSFYPTKNLGALGDGGMVVTDQPEMARHVRLLREYGWEERHISLLPGWNSRLDEVQAAILRIKLRYLEQDNTARIRIAAMYRDGLTGCGMTLPSCRQEASHVYHLYVVRMTYRDALKRHLKEKGIDALIHYPVPIHLQPVYQGRLTGVDQLLETERAAQEVLSLPIYPELNEADLEAVIKAVSTFCLGYNEENNP
jgi:dTDP-4-amino-4,6-dideoxygalactose transaminase